MVKNLPVNAGDVKRCRLNPWAGKIPWSRACNQLQYSCMENSMDRGSWQATVNGVAKSRTRLKQLNMHIHMISWLCLPVVMYGCAGWTIKKAEHEELILLNCGVGEDS